MDRLPDSTVCLLGSTQVITSVFSVVKELFENSLDAGATSIEVKLENYGLDKIEVRDSGSGIQLDDIPVFAKRHYTSKITSHTDLETLTTYGFRGEALASLCAVSEVTVTTKTPGQDVGFTYSLSDQGDVISTTPSHLGQGTTVCAKSLFKNLPVRKQYHNMAKKKKEDLKNVENLLMVYGVIQPAVRISLCHNKELVWQKLAQSDSRAVLFGILGKGIMGQMEWKKQEHQDPEMRIEMCLPKPGSDVTTMSRSAPDRSYLTINGRPVIVKDLDKLIRQYYSNCHACDISRHPVYFVRIDLPARDVDVNLEPNKTTVMTTNMVVLRERLEEILLYMYGPLDQAPSWRYKDATAEDEDPGAKPQVSHFELSQFQKNHDEVHENSKTSAVASCSLSYSAENGRPSSPVMISHTNQKENHSGSVVKENVNKVGTTASVQMSEKSSETGTTSSRVESEDVIVCQENVNLGSPAQCDSNVQTVVNNQDISDLDLEKEILDEVLCSLPSTTPASDKSSRRDDECRGLQISQMEVNSVEKQTCDSESNSDYKAAGELCKESGDPTSVLSSSSCEVSDISSCQNKEFQPQVSGAPQPGTSGWSWGTSLISSAGTLIQPVQLLAPTPSHFPGKRPVSPSHDKQVQKQSAPPEKRQATGGRRLCPAQSTLYDMINNVAVKRPMSAREIFFKEKRPKVVEENPKSDYDEVTEILGEMWDALPETELQAYHEKCWQDTQRYSQEAAAARNVSGQLKAKTKTKMITSIRDMVAAACTQLSPKPVGKKKVVTYSSQHMVPFSMTHLKTCMDQGTPSSPMFFPCTLVLASLPSCKSWVCGRGRTLCLLNLHRLSETLLYHRLLHQHKLVAHHCQLQRLLPSNLGNCWEVLEKLAKESRSLDPLTHITDCRITANGFHIKCWKDADGSLIAELVGICSDVPTYGLPDLCEVLELISSCDGSSLAKTRPLKVDNYLRGEAVRMARMQTADKGLEDVQDLLEQAASFLPPGCTSCLHDRPFYHMLLADLDTMAAGTTQDDAADILQESETAASIMQE